MYINSLSDLELKLQHLQKDEKTKSLMLFACDTNQLDINKLKAILEKNKKPLLGGIFPEIIAEGKRTKKGFCLVGLKDEIEVLAMDSSEQNVLKLKQDISEIKSVFCFVNALWDNKNQFINSLYDEFGPFVEYLGGGAGSLSFKSIPCIFANQQIIENGAVVGFMKKQMKIELAHGWEPVSDIIKVTKTNGNDIVSLNWKPAFEVYQEFLQQQMQLSITPDNFFDIAKSHPFGLVRLNDEMIIRDPFGTDGHKINMVDEVPEGEYIKIMHGDLNSLLGGAKKVIDCMELNLDDVDTRLCVDCISRVLFMEEKFDKELTLVNKGLTCNGVLSIGEIAKPKETSLALFNKTIVVGQWKNND